MKHLYWVFCIILLSSVSCAKRDLSDDSLLSAERAFTVSINTGEKSSKTVVDSETGKLSWKPGDAIEIFLGTKGARFTSTETTVTQKASFVGRMPNMEGVSEDCTELLAFYPYDEKASSNGTTITTVLTGTQSAAEDTFADGLFISVGKTDIESNTIDFYNLCGGIRFRVEEDGINKVICRGNNSEVLAGKIEIALDENGIPRVSEVLEPETEIVLTCPEGFSPGRWYYIVTLPGLFSNGYSLSFQSDSKESKMVYPNSVELKRNRFRSLDISTDDLNNNSRWDFRIPDTYLNATSIIIEVDSTKPASSYFDLNASGNLWLVMDGETLRIQTNAGRIIGRDTFLNGDSYYSSRGLFEGFTEATTITGLENIDMSRVENMNRLFYDCSKLESLDLSSFDTRNVIEMRGMFENCKNLENIDLSSFVTSKVVDMNSLFCNCYSLTNLDLSNFDTRNVKDMKYMFSRLEVIKSLDLHNLVSDNVEDMNGMFSYCFKLDNLDLSWMNTAKVKDMNAMFYRCENLSSLDLSGFVTDKVEGMVSMFSECRRLTNLDISSFNTENVTEMSYMFSMCLVYDLDLRNFDTRNVKNMNYMFQNCSASTIDLSSFKTDKVEWISGMFSGCRGLKYLTLSNDFVIPDHKNNMFYETGMYSSTLLKSKAIIKGVSDENLKSALKTDTGWNDSYIAFHIPVESIFLDEESVTLTEGDTFVLTAIVNPFNASDKGVKWTSSNSNVASVDENGEVTALKAGNTIITATSVDSGLSASCTIVVEAKIYPVESVSLNYSSVELHRGETLQLQATITPSNATNKNVSWSSSDSSVASVSANGKVTATAIGTSVISVTTEDGKKTASCTITVIPINHPVTGVSLNKSSATLNEGETIQLLATVNPSNASNKNVSWTSGNDAVATVDAGGMVKALSEGISVITVITEDGGKTASCTVTVLANVNHVESVSLDRVTADLQIGEKLQLNATVSPSDATNKTLYWKSDNPSVAIVDSNGLVTAVDSGSALITVTTEDGQKTATCAVTVSPVYYPVTSVRLSKTTAELVKGKTFYLYAYITPDNATNQNVTWTSSDDRIATVDEIGMVQGYEAGTAYITVTTEDGHKTATCMVTVVDSFKPVVSVSLDKSSAELAKGETLQLTAKINPDDATNKRVSWRSSNSAIAYVDSNGLVTAVRLGSAIITVVTENGNKEASCAISVVTKPGNEGFGEENGEW